MRYLIPTLAVALMAVPSAHAGWGQIKNKTVPSHPADSTDSCFGIQSALASASSIGTHASGLGFAYEWTGVCHSFAQNNAAGYRLRSWKYTKVDKCDPDGWAQVDAHAQGNGSVNLVSGDCAAAAVGYALVESSLLNGPVLATLTESAGEAGSQTLGTINITVKGEGGSIGGSIPIEIHNGHGTYSDTDNSGGFNQDCVDSVTVYEKTRVELEFSAGDWMWVSECNGSAALNARGTVSLGVCKTTPPCDDPLPEDADPTDEPEKPEVTEDSEDPSMGDDETPLYEI